MPVDALPFQETIDYLISKVDIPSRSWTDMRHGAHVRGFTVAGATTLQLVSDFHRSMVKMITEGRTLADFRKDFDKIVAAQGWSYNGSRGWRSAVIYNTNLRTAHAVGRWAQIQEVRDSRPYLRYSTILDDRTRQQHSDWHGLVLRIDDPFWDYATPPNGWNCRCTIQSVSEADLRRYGWTVSASPALTMETRTVTLADGSKETLLVPEGIDTGFGYNPGADWMSGAVPPQLQHPLDPPGWQGPPPQRPPFAAPRPVDPARILTPGLEVDAYINAFLAEFGASPTTPVLYRDPSGQVVPITVDLFLARNGQPKGDKHSRGRYLPLLAEALKDPDEIWATWQLTAHGAELRRKYLVNLDLSASGLDGAIAVFEWGPGGWNGVTMFPADAGQNYLEKERRGALLYRKI